VICYAVYREQPKRRFAWWVLPVSVFGSLLLYMTAYARFKGQVVVGAPFCLALALLIPFVSEIPLTIRPLRTVAKTVAKYSYGIYLFHDPCIRFAFEGVGSVPIWARFVISFALTFALSVVAYHSLEYPMIKLGSRVATKIA
jgi:peptidoglycan/LPS O-acetylase OafA/YrhL